jgi:hypothetical protein
VVFTNVSAVKASYVSLGTNTYPLHLPLIRVSHMTAFVAALFFAERHRVVSILRVRFQLFGEHSMDESDANRSYRDTDCRRGWR